MNGDFGNGYRVCGRMATTCNFGVIINDCGIYLVGEERMKEGIIIGKYTLVDGYNNNN